MEIAPPRRKIRITLPPQTAGPEPIERPCVICDRPHHDWAWAGAQLRPHAICGHCAVWKGLWATDDLSFDDVNFLAEARALINAILTEASHHAA